MTEKSKTHVEEIIFKDLHRSQKKISSMFFYDETGSRLFERITQLPEYYLTRTEIPLIKQAAAYLKDDLVEVNIIEFGSGDETKISMLLDSISQNKRKTICYIPFDISESAVQKSCDILLQKYTGLQIHGIVADFMTQLDVINNKSNNIFCFLGSTIGNFSRNQSIDFLKKLYTIMNRKDRVLLGFDMVKDKKIIEQAYNDNQKVTAQFNKNILNVINKLTDTNFNPASFEHLAFYNEEKSRIEMHLKAMENIYINSSRFPEPIHLEKGETIHTENSYKFTTDHIRSLAESSCFTIEKIFSDNKNWFNLAVFTKLEENKK